ncbi:hypothetical protein K2X33_12205, partial [bacterium]|nr:hypothetical protein [bacterium]
NLNGFMDRRRLALLLNDNPYSCGDSSAPARVDWLAARAMTPEVYYTAMGLDDDLDVFASQLGVEAEQRDELDLTGAGVKRMLADVPNATDRKVGVNPQRVLERRNRANSPGTAFYRSYDFIEFPSPGTETQSRDVLLQGSDFTWDASEMIFTKCNGYMGFYLANAKGQRQRSAPAEIAIDSSKSVTAPDRCLKCHANGFIGGKERRFNQDDTFEYADHYGELATLDNGAHRNKFRPNEEYGALAKADSLRFMDAKVATGAHIPADPNRPNGDSAAILPDLIEEYRAPMSMEQAAAELGVPVDKALTDQLGTNIYFRETKDLKNPDVVVDKKPFIKRTDFERIYCRVRANMGLGGNGGAGVVQGGFRGPNGTNGANHGSQINGQGGNGQGGVYGNPNPNGTYNPGAGAERRRYE